MADGKFYHENELFNPAGIFLCGAYLHDFVSDMFNMFICIQFLSMGKIVVAIFYYFSNLVLMLVVLSKYSIAVCFSWVSSPVQNISHLVRKHTQSNKTSNNEQNETKLHMSSLRLSCYSHTST